MDLPELQAAVASWINAAGANIALWLQSPEFFLQLAAILLAMLCAFLLAAILRRRVGIFQSPDPSEKLYRLRSTLFRFRVLLVPLLSVVLLALTAALVQGVGYPVWLVRVAESAALIALLYTVIVKFVNNSFIKALGKWVGVPVATLAVFGWLEPVVTQLDAISLSVGNIRLSLYALARTLVFGSILFWLGRLSNTAGKDAIRSQKQLDVGTREVFAKLFEIGVFVLVFLLLLQVMGISLTALAVFGGALGVGLGFGLQQIASNFISGIIILLDRSLSIGDHVELEDGRAGTLRELNMRFGVLETYDGKDIVVPNEQFITSSYTNWTHKDPQQRYAIEFQVAYDTDLDSLFEDLRALCRAHPQVVSGEVYPLELQPDAEIAGFGDSGIDVLVEYWMEGIDDGANRVEADLLLSIFHLFRDKDYEFPFPQREVRILGEGALHAGS